MSAKKHNPLGPNGSWKTGQRVPVTGVYVDQDGVVSEHDEHDTFPPCVGFGRKGEVAYRYLIRATGTAA